MNAVKSSSLCLQNSLESNGNVLMGTLKERRVKNSMRFAPLPEERNENIEYFIPLSGNRTHNCRGYSHTPVLRRPEV